jgi:hypothetical protein
MYRRRTPGTAVAGFGSTLARIAHSLGARTSSARNRATLAVAARDDLVFTRSTPPWLEGLLTSEPGLFAGALDHSQQ